MSSSIHLCALTRALVSVNTPLKWDVFSEKGQLLLHEGYVISTEAQLLSLLGRGMYANALEVDQKKIESRPVIVDPFLEWDGLKALAARNNLARLRGCNTEILSSLDAKVAGINDLLDNNQSVAIFELMQMDLTNYVTAHNLQMAILVTILGKRMNWNPVNIEILCRASATMNIAILELQSTLVSHKSPLTPAQRDALKNHGKRGREILENIGVTNRDWLVAVEEHHPESLPVGRVPSEMAMIIHRADVYLAKISPRSYRIGKPPNVAAKEMLQERGFSQNIAGVLIKEIGIYPPGSYVRLANGETAIVTQRGAQAHTPIVFSLLNPGGMPLGEPVPRDTNSAAFAVTSIVPRSKVMVTLNRVKLFGNKKYADHGRWKHLGAE